MKITFWNNLGNTPNELLIPVAGEAILDKVANLLEPEIAVSPEILKKDFKGENGDIHTLYQNNKRIFLIGLGEKPSLNTTVKCFRKFSFKNKENLSCTIGLSLLHDNLGEDLRLIEAAVNGLLLGGYQIGRFKSTAADLHPLDQEDSELQIFIAEALNASAETAARKGEAFAQTQRSIFDLVNAPSNKKLPTDLAHWARNSGQLYDYKVEVFEKDKIIELGLHALLAVNRGSEHPPTFTVMEYKPENAENCKRVGIVGKGVTFDTGGLSIKPSTNMHFMKSDMGGAAAVFGAMELCAKLKLPIHLIGIVPSTDNSVGSLAIKPSDVIDSYSGKTIEIIDTDAEGRLILADGIYYMVQHYKPEVLIDLATLTGSAVRTFGYHAAGLFSNDDDLAQQISNASEVSGEMVWRLPLWDVYKEDIKSDVADVRNFSGRPMAGAIGAAKFLEVFTDNHPRWAHMDIAGVAFSDMEFSTQKSATAFGVRLLMEYLESLTS